ncbi:GAF and ANTAR domain-containing protein [Cryptosporangium arvum]|uniref:GAF and ANTAR domain-containing protein n=1 Tax=Cryptosporangium arvum TaxID=80871 RepID=UPI00055DB2A4|nr:GAF and ANTAR domain-containing protein [Cryptosporangium arvum]
MKSVVERESAIRRLIDAQPPVAGARGTLLRICRAATGVLAASGAGVSVFTPGDVRGVCAASDPRSERLEELQFVLGEGPCIDAFESRRPVLVTDLVAYAEARWPMYTPAVYERGVRAVFAFPLQIGGARLGVLDVFRDQEGALSAEQLTDALTFADVAVAMLLDEHDDSNGGVGQGVIDAVDSRAELFQAQGMVMVQIGGTINEAMVRLRAYAYAENRALSEIARDVVAGRLSFDQDES